MTTATLTLTAFLLQRIAEDEAVARAASNAPWTALTFYPNRSEVTNETELDGGVIVATPRKDDADASHIARHDPGRVLARCKADQAIAELHAPEQVNGYGVGPIPVCAECGPFEDVLWRAGREGNYPCPTLRALASVYADHEDFNPDWR